MQTNKSSRVLVRKSGNGHRDVIDRDVKARVNAATQPRSRRKAVAIYFAINIIFIIGVFLLSLSGHKSGHNPALYLVLLVALLSSPLLFIQSFTGPYLVLVVAAPFFFLMYAMGDLVAYVGDVASVYAGRSSSIISYGETGVLIAFLSLFLGYAGAVRTLRSKSRRWFVAEWPVSTTLIAGLALFTAGIIATFVFQVRFSGFQIQTTPKMDALVLNAIVLGRMVGDLGEILLAYTLVRTRNRAITIFIVALIILKLPLGIILNSKLIGLTFVVAYLVVALIYNKRIPWKIMLISGLAITLMFPLAYTYRAYMGKYYVSVGETLEDISGHLGKALTKDIDEQKKRGLRDAVMEGLDSFAERADMKPLVELTMARAGKDLPYQNGYTLTPLLYVLIPRMILPDKPSVATGQLFNQKFNLSPDPETWISASFISELYWNFSWIGIVVGMLIVGYTLGAVGSIANMDACTSVARLLIVLITITTLVFRFESAIAQQYSVFIRSLIIVVFLHILFSKRKKPAMSG